VQSKDGLQSIHTFGEALLSEVNQEIEPKQQEQQNLSTIHLLQATLRALGLVDTIDFGGNLHQLPRSNYSIH
jgi:hypothetical protein